jgi:hypothetical protein
LINKWENAYQHTSTAYLLEDGNLLRSTRLPDPNGGGGGFQVLDWEGNVVWEYTYGPQHHDIEPMPSGNVLLITNHTIENSAALDAGADPSLHTGDVVSLTILEIANTNGTGEIVWQWNAWDHIVQEFDQGKPNYGVIAEHPEFINLNYVPNTNNKWIHPNSIDYNEGFNQIMISARSYNELWIIDHSPGSDGNLLYRWGNPAAYNLGDEDDQFLYGQHDARWIEPGLPGEGNITAFNNGLNRPDSAYSSIDEISPPIDVVGNYSRTTGTAYGPNSLTWSYIAAEPTDMYSSKFSGAHRLPNGNTLICNGVGGELIEVTSTGEIVWKYVNPESTDGILEQGSTPGKNDVFRAHKYALDYPGFDGKDLKPGDLIELYTDTDGDGITDGYDNCPDEINPGQEDDDGNGIGNVCDPNSLAVDERDGIVEVFRLEQNHPNPFNPTTNITFDLVESSFVSLIIYDIVGNQIRTMVYENMEPGVKKITWNALDDAGNPVSSGLYFYTINAGQDAQTKKMMLLR